MAEAGTPWQLEFDKVELRCGHLLTSGQLSDCTFVVGSETNQVIFPAHKLVLAMASPVFEAMFFGGLSECKEPIVTIPDVQPDGFKALLQYIYTGYTNIGSFDLALDLWYGAKKYMLPHLEKECNNYICTMLVPRNACRVYEFANLFEAKVIMDKCIQIISTNTKEVLKDSSFEYVDLNTLITVFSLDHLNVDSELDLCSAAARYAKAGQRMQEQEDGGPPLEKMFKRLQPPEKKVLLNVESSETSHAEELNSKPPTKAVTPKPTAAEENFIEEEEPIRAAIKKIRFLSLTREQFEEGPALSGLLTESESMAVLKNIDSRDSAVPMPTGFSVCRERRQPPSDLVDEAPNDKPRRKPGVAATKLPTLDEILGDLESRHRETLERAARAARQMTCADAGTANIASLVEANGIPSLLAALLRPWTGVQYNAAWALTNVACVEQYARTIVHDGGVPKLVALLGHGGGVAEQAAWALGNIARAGDPPRKALVDAGAGPALLAHMLPCTPTAQLFTYVWAYRAICENICTSELSRTPKFESISYAMTYIENLLVLADEGILAEACWTVYHLAYNESYPELYTSLAARLTDLLGAAAPRVQAAALAAVGSMLVRTEPRKQYIEAGGLTHIIYFLSHGIPLHVKYAARAAFYILNSATLPGQHVSDKRILDALGLVLTEGDDECKLIAVRMISKLCAQATDSKLCVLANHSTLLESYCRLLAAENDTDTSMFVLRGLNDMIRNFSDNVKHALCMKLREIGVPQLLITWRQDKREWNRNLALGLLKTYFGDQ